MEEKLAESTTSTKHWDFKKIFYKLKKKKSELWIKGFH